MEASSNSSSSSPDGGIEGGGVGFSDDSQYPQHGLYFEAGRVKFEGLEMSLLLSSQENAALSPPRSCRPSGAQSLTNAAGYIPIGGSITSTGNPHPCSIFASGGLVKGLLILKVTRPVMIKGLYVKLAAKNTVIKKSTKRQIGHNSVFDDDSIILSLSKVSSPILVDPYTDSNNDNDNNRYSKNTAVFSRDSLYHTFLGVSDCDSDLGQLVELPSSLNCTSASGSSGSSRFPPIQRKRHMYSFRYYLPDNGPVSYCDSTSSIAYELSACLETPLISSVVSQIQYGINVANRRTQNVPDDRYIAGLTLHSCILSRQNDVVLPLKVHGLLNTFKSFFKMNQSEKDDKQIEPGKAHIIIKSTKKSTFPFKTFEYRYPLEISLQNFETTSKKSAFVTIQLMTQVISRFNTSDSFSDIVEWYYNKFDGVEEDGAQKGPGSVCLASYDKGSVTSYLIDEYKYNLSKTNNKNVVFDVPIRISTYEYFFSVTNWPKQAPISHSQGYIVSPSFESTLTKVRTVIEVTVHKDAVTETRVPDRKLMFERGVIEVGVIPTASPSATDVECAPSASASTALPSASLFSAAGGGVGSRAPAVSMADRPPMDHRLQCQGKENSPQSSNKTSTAASHPAQLVKKDVPIPVAASAPFRVKSHAVPQVSLAMVVDRFNRSHDHLDTTQTALAVAHMHNVVVLDNVDFSHPDSVGSNSKPSNQFSPIMVDPVLINMNSDKKIARSSLESPLSTSKSNVYSHASITTTDSGLPSQSSEMDPLRSFSSTISTCRSLINQISNSPALTRLAGRSVGSGLRRPMNAVSSGGHGGGSGESVAQRLDFDSILFSSASASSLYSDRVSGGGMLREGLSAIQEGLSPVRVTTDDSAINVRNSSIRSRNNGEAAGGDNLVYPYYSSLFSPRLVPTRIEEI